MRNTLQAVLDHKGGVVHHITPSSTVLEAVRKMNQERIGALLVCADDELFGIFTERDLLTRVLDSDRDPAQTRIADVMTSRVVVVSPATTVDEAMAIITEQRCRHLPVMEGGKLVGLVSIGDLTRWMTRKQHFEIQNLVNYITRKYPA